MQLRCRYFILTLVMLFWFPLNPLVSVAEFMDAGKAEQVAQNWLSRSGQSGWRRGTGEQVARIRAIRDQGHTVAYAALLSPGGFIILSSDDRIEPIIAFGSGELKMTDQDNPLLDIVRVDMAQRLQRVAVSSGRRGGKSELTPAQRKWAMLAAAPSRVSRTKADSVSDVWVEPFLQSTWNQSTVWDGEAYKACYNYYTPPYTNGAKTNYVCGCVATTYAQVSRYFCFPNTAVGTNSRVIHVDDVAQTNTLRGGDGAGGAYNYSAMPLEPGTGITEQQRQAIGALCYDMGLAAGMYYESGGSAAYMSPDELTNTMQFSNAIFGYGDHARFSDMLNATLDARIPVPLSIKRTGGGHLVVCDGYGYDTDTLYHHLNLGWGGTANAWYELPLVDASDTRIYTSVKYGMYNIYTNGTGEIISGRVVDSQGAPLSGVSVTAAGCGTTNVVTTDANGIYVFSQLPANTSFVLTAQSPGLYFASRTVQSGESVSFEDTGNRWAVTMKGFTNSGGVVLSGVVTNSLGSGIPQVSVSITGEEELETDPGGYFATYVAADWSGCVAVARSGFVFDVTSRQVATGASDQTDINFCGRMKQYVKQDAGGADDGTSWDNAYTSLTNALAVASPGSVFWIAAGTYVPGTTSSQYFSVPEGAQLVGGFAGTETNLSERDLMKKTTLLSGDIGVPGDRSDNCTRVLYLHDGAEVYDLTISSANNTSTNGGGVYAADAENTLISGCTISDNHATYGGGAYGGYFERCIFSSNSASSYGGGAGYAALVSCLLYSNSAGTGGGAVWNSGGTNLTIVDNSGGNRGGGVNLGTYANCIIVSNQALANPDWYSATLTYCCTVPAADGMGNHADSPEFVDYAAHDFQLVSGSPCVNTGTNAAWMPDALDLAGNPRISLEIVDRGAYEYVGTEAALCVLPEQLTLTNRYADSHPALGTLSVSNSGDAACEFSSSSSVPWLVTTPASGQLAGRSSTDLTLGTVCNKSPCRTIHQQPPAVCGCRHKFAANHHGVPTN